MVGRLFAAVFGNQEAEPVRMSLDDADDEIELGKDAKLALAIGEDLAVALHGGEPAFVGLLRDALDAQGARQFLGRHRRACGSERLQDVVARGQRRRIGIVARAASVRRVGLEMCSR